MGGMLHWAPWYSKINVFNSILYFDWYFGVGLGMTASDVNYTRSATGATTRENNMTFFWCTGQQFHVSDLIKVRLEFTASHFKAPIFATGTGGDEAWQNTYNIGLGLGFRL
jgi:outer membrane beta-barrel protein